MKVFKFGGASVKDASAVKNVGNILALYKNEPVFVVISAMGKMTNALERLTHAYCQGNDAKVKELYEVVKEFHLEIVKELLQGQKGHAYDDIENILLELECLLESDPESSQDYIYDQIVSYGEIISTKIVSVYLNEAGVKNRWMDCRNFIVTDNRHREGVVDMLATEAIISKKLLPIAKKQLLISQGFLGRSNDLSTTTLGRDGSDYSAAIFAYGLNADSVTIWKDVAGVMNADPKRMPDAQLFSSLSFKEAIELAYYGANVIHPKTIQPLREKNIPLYVKSFYQPTEAGTLINAQGEAHTAPIFIHKENQVLLSIATKDFSFIVEEHLSEIFAVFSKLNLKINLMQASAISFSVCVNNEADKIKTVVETLNKTFEFKMNEGVELISVKNYNQQAIEKISEGRQILLEQKTRLMDQFVIK
jgi:aspartate kinase